jgi:hypothetical protein
LCRKRLCMLCRVNAFTIVNFVVPE